jgi:phenylpropionate dioxygenase-like ring-hydroxylating dioxygenase large terminal subunit
MPAYHPLMFSRSVPFDRPVPVRFQNKNLVVWRTVSHPNKVHCMEDRCPHRNAQLSKGFLTENTLVCGYHGWEFDGNGRCTDIPQRRTSAEDPRKPVQPIPKSCHLKTIYPITECADILYIGWGAASGASQDSPIGLYPEASVSSDEAFITDYPLEANYSFWIQLENLMDPAHIHFVHDGFQGDRAKAKHIAVRFLTVSDTHLEAEFTHNDPLIPDIRILYRPPGTIDVRIYNQKRQVVRRNIIMTTPTGYGKCRVLFRDIAYKAFLVPNGDSGNSLASPFQRFATHLLQNNRIEETYQALNQTIVEKIMEQDIQILESQQANMGPYLVDYLNAPEVLATDSDAMIRAFRRWCREHRDKFNEWGYF